MIQFDRYFSSWLVQPPASESKKLVQTFHVVSLLDLSFPPLKGGMMHYGGAAASGTTTAGGVLIFRCGEDKPKIFSQFLLFKKNGEFGCGNGYHDTISPNKFTQKPTLCFEVTRLTFWKKAIFFPHYWVIAQFLGSLDDSSHFGKFHREVSETFGATGISMGIFPGSFRFENRQDDGGPTLLQRILNVGKRCVGIFARSSPPEPNPEVGSGGGWLVGGGNTLRRQSYFPDNPSDGQWTAQFRFLSQWLMSMFFLF